jgi:hypothetical protein
VLPVAAFLAGIECIGPADAAMLSPRLALDVANAIRLRNAQGIIA